MFSKIIKLLKTKETINEYGDVEIVRDSKEVLGRIDRIYFSESLEAMAQGFERQIRIRLADYYDYEDEEYLEYNGKVWQIANVQIIGKEVELNCVGGIDHAKA